MDHSSKASNIFNSLAKQYAEKYMDVNAYSDSFNTFGSLLHPLSPRILELGCGPGNITKFLLNQRTDLNILGTDLAPNMLSIAKKENPTAEFKLLDSRKIDTIEQRFNGIISGFILPYLNKTEVEKLIRDAASLLLPKGIFYLSTMEGEYSKSGFERGSNKAIDPVFMHYYEGSVLKDMLVKSGFEIQYEKRIETNTQTKANDVMIIAQLK